MKHGGGLYQQQHQRENAAHQTARLAVPKTHPSLGATGHWVRLAGILAPLVIGEFIHDPAKRWRAVRVAIVATTLISEGMWTHKIGKEREEAKQKALECAEELAGHCGAGAYGGGGAAL
jgi:hypothetical protein